MEEEEDDVGGGHSKRFHSLLRRLASEHESEVRALREEVARLRGGEGEDEVARLRAEVMRLQRYRGEPKSLPSQDLTSWLPLCRGCKDGSEAVTLEEDMLSEAAQSNRVGMPVVVIEPALTEGGWNSDAVPSEGSRSRVRNQQSTFQKSLLNGSSGRSPGVGAAAKGARLSCGAGVPWDSRGDVQNSPEWKDPALIARELDAVAEDSLDLAGNEEDHDEASRSSRRMARQQSKQSTVTNSDPLDHDEASRSSRRVARQSTVTNSDAEEKPKKKPKRASLFSGITNFSEESELTEMHLPKVTEADPMECWTLLVNYAKGHSQCKSCWIDAVANWKKSQQTSSANLELGKMITILVPRSGQQADKDHSMESDDSSSRIVRCMEVFVCHPNSRRRILWDMLGVLLLLHDLIMLPMGAFQTGTSGLGESYAEFLRVFDLCSSVFWTCDMVVSFLTGYFTQEGFTEVRLGPVARHYLKSWFPLDLFIVTTDWTAFFFAGLGPTSALLRMGKTVSRFMRVLRLLRFMKLNTTMRDLLVCINSEYILTLVNLTKILLGMVIMNHYIACVWYLLSVSIREDGFYHTWTETTLGPSDTEVRLAYAYSTSLHWSLTQFTPASMEVFPENEFERFFNIVVIIFALVIFSSFVSGITQAMTHIRNINSARMAREGEIRIFLSSNKVTHKLASRIWRCVRQNNTAALGQRRVKIDAIPLLKMLPEPIKEDLRQEVFVPHLSLHPLFREYFTFDPDVVLHFCSVAVSEASLRAGEHVVLDWKVVKELIFVLDGCMEYHYPGADEPEIVNKGEWACESTLWATRASLDGPLLAGPTGAEIVKVDSAAVQKVAENHPASSDFLGRYARIFVTRFNQAILDENIMPLFNDQEEAETMTDEVLKQCGKARGLSSRKRRISGKDLASMAEVRNLLSYRRLSSPYMDHTASR